MKQAIQGVLAIPDVLEGLSVEVEGYLVDAVVNVKVLQHGSYEFEVTELDVTTDIRITDKSGAFLGHIKYNDHDDTFKEKFETMVELVALEKARNTKEDSWEYQYLD